MLVTPVLYEDDSIGVLSLYVDRPHRFNDDEKLIARALRGSWCDRRYKMLDYTVEYLIPRKALRKSERLTTLGTLGS
jgi:hypothetical protein